MQSRTSSFIESCLNTASGFALSFVVWHFVALAYAIPMPLSTNLQITGIFTVVSVIRSYVWRRLFNKREKTRTPTPCSKLLGRIPHPPHKCASPACDLWPWPGL